MGKRFEGVRLTTRADLTTFAAVLDSGKPFKAGDNLRGDRDGVPYLSGSLSGSELEQFRNADYAVWSYAEPIAWRVPGAGWYVTGQKFSQTTSAHTLLIARAIEVWDMWASDAVKPSRI